MVTSKARFGALLCTKMCGTSFDIEMHHVKSVKDVRNRFLRKETVACAKFAGARSNKKKTDSSR